MRRCCETFELGELSGRSLQIAVDERHPHFACEQESCSSHSPGIVSDLESVAFLLINPLHFDEDRRTVVPDAFQELFNRDLSLARLEHTSSAEALQTKNELIERGRERTPPQLRLIDYVCLASVESVRNACIDGDRILAVYDTALPNKKGHASMFTTKKVFESRLLRKRTRSVVHGLMSKHLTTFASLFVKE